MAYTGASADFADAETGLTMTCNLISAAEGAEMGIFVSWAPAAAVTRRGRVWRTRNGRLVGGQGMITRTPYVLLGIVILTQAPAAQRVGVGVSGAGGSAYTLMYLVEDGNGIDPALDTSSLPNIPRSWRSEAIAVNIGSTNGMALRGLSDLNNKTGYRSRFDFYLASDSTDNDTFCSIAVGKAISALEFFDENTSIAFYIDFYKNTAGERTFRTRIPTMSGELITTWSGTVELQTVHRFDNTYDITNENYTLEIDGTTVIDRDFDMAAIDSIDTLVLGSSGGSTCRNVIYLIGRVLESPLGPRRFPSRRPRSRRDCRGLAAIRRRMARPMRPPVGQSLGCTSPGASSDAQDALPS